MICGVCLKESETVKLTDFGAICPECLPGLQEKEEALYEGLLSEEPLSMPPFLDVPAFERVMLRFALHYLMKLDQEHIEHLRSRRPGLLRPRLMALYLKEKVTAQIPLYYVSSMDSEGRDRLLYGGTYQFKKDVPEKVIMDAMAKAGLLKDEEETA